jgi:allophanate hydrolase subunit 1
MAGITYFVALPFDVADGSVVIGEPIECLSPAAAIERAQGLWKVLGHTGAVAFSRSGDPATAISATDVIRPILSRSGASHQRCVKLGNVENGRRKKNCYRLY